MKNKTNTALYTTAILSLISSGLYFYSQKINLTDPTNSNVVMALGNWVFALALIAGVVFVLLKVTKK